MTPKASSLSGSAGSSSGPLPGSTNAVENLLFHEINIAALGYSADGASGRAMGRGTAIELAHTALEIVKAGVKDPVIFELAGLFQPRVGADLISDMTLAIILPDVIAYNDRLRKQLKLTDATTRIADRNYRVPCHAETMEPILILPREILSPLPVAYSWEDIDQVTSYNRELRRRVNSM